MTSLTELAEETGLISPESIQEIALKAPIRKLCKLIDKTVQVISMTQPPEPNPDLSTPPFTYVASSSIRSDSGCRDWHCRAEKLISLAHYATLLISVF